MELTQGPPPPGEPHPAAAGEPQPAPATVRVLGLVLHVQAAGYVLVAMVAGIAYLARGADTLSLGGYATARTHPATMLVVGLAATGLLFWLAHRIPARKFGLYRLISITELALLVDGVIGVLVGIFSIWWIACLLTAVAALWYLRAEDTKRYLD